MFSWLNSDNYFTLVIELRKNLVEYVTIKDIINSTIFSGKNFSDIIIE